MGYETSSYYMYGVKVSEYFEEFKDLYFTEAIDMYQSMAAEELGEEEKEFVKSLKDFWNPLFPYFKRRFERTCMLPGSLFPTTCAIDAFQS